MIRVRTFAAALAVGVALVSATSGCSSRPDGLSQQAISSAMPTPQDLPGGSWSVVGTTHTRPSTMAAVDELVGARGTSSACQGALRALAAPTPAPAGFARTVLRSTNTTDVDTRNLTLSVETTGGAPERPARIQAVTAACTDAMKTAVGKAGVVMKLRPDSYPTDGYTGYSVSYDAGGLTEYYDEVVAVQGHTMVTASISGPKRADNQQVLAAAVKTVLTRLEATRQA